EPPVRLLAAISFSLRKVHHAGQLRRAGLDLKSACQKAGIFSNAVESTGLQHTHLGPRRVGQLPNLLLKADLDLKGSSMLPPRSILEKLLVQLSRPRED
ncbi:DNA polymerase III subunit delta, partial [Singulisphaera rosea]